MNYLLGKVGSVDFETERLACFEKKGFSRYYLGIKGVQKPCKRLYFSTGTLKLTQELTPRKISRRSVR